MLRPLVAFFRGGLLVSQNDSLFGGTKFNDHTQKTRN